MQIDYTLDALINGDLGSSADVCVVTVVPGTSDSFVSLSVRTDCPVCDQPHGVSVALDAEQMRELRDALDAALGEKRHTAPF